MRGPAIGARDTAVNKTDRVLNRLRRRAMNRKVMKVTADPEK